MSFSWCKFLCLRFNLLHEKRYSLRLIISFHFRRWKVMKLLSNKHKIDKLHSHALSLALAYSWHGIQFKSIINFKDIKRERWQVKRFSHDLLICWKGAWFFCVQIYPSCEEHKTRLECAMWRFFVRLRKCNHQ